MPLDMVTLELASDTERIKSWSTSRFQAKTKVMTGIIRDFVFADDCALNAGSEADKQRSVNKFSDACNNFGLTISIKKTSASSRETVR